MSAFPGKVRIVGVMTLRDMMHESLIDALRPATGRIVQIDPDQPVLVCDFIQTRDPALVRTLFFAAFDPAAAWLNQLGPAFAKEKFPFQCEGDRERIPPLHSLTECLLN